MEARVRSDCSCLQLGSIQSWTQSEADRTETLRGTTGLPRCHPRGACFRGIVAIDVAVTTPSPLAFVLIRANLFMEELWKHYTDPSILDGTYPLPVHRFKKIYLTTVRDWGSPLLVLHHAVLP